MNRVRIKFCGVRTPEDARLAIDAGADAVGMILHADARRLIHVHTAGEITQALPPFVTPVGVFVDAPPEVVHRTANAIGLTTVQFHGDETPADVDAVRPLRVIKAVRCVRETIHATLDTWRQAVDRDQCPNLVGLLLESPSDKAAGGTGEMNDIALISELVVADAFNGLPPIILSGGLTPNNVAGHVRSIRPFGVDVSSGIEETFGVKSPRLMAAFAAAVASVVDDR